jgi:hypothetical protein
MDIRRKMNGDDENSEEYRKNMKDKDNARSREYYRKNRSKILAQRR